MRTPFVFLALLFLTGHVFAWDHCSKPPTNGSLPYCVGYNDGTYTYRDKFDGLSDAPYQGRSSNWECAKYKNSDGSYAGAYQGFACWNDATCPAGKHVNSDGACVVQPVGSTCDNQGVCTCPAGQIADTGTNADIVNGYPATCATPTAICSRRAGQSFITFNDATVSSDGCAVNCAINTGDANLGVAHMKCTYTGSVANGNGTADANVNKPDTQVVGTGNQSLPLPPLYHDPNPNGGCNAGEAYGYINNQAACVPQTKSDGTPNVPSTTVNAQSQTTVTNTQTQTNADGSTTTVTTTTTVVTGSSGNGTSGNGNGNGNGNGANQCDPTAADYAACIHMADAVKAGVDGSVVAAGGGGGDGQGGNQTYGNADYTQWFNTADVDQQIEQARQDFKDQFQNASQNLGEALDLSGSASLPSFGPVSVLGTSISFDLSQYASQLSIVAQALLVISLIISAYIVLHR